jgi:hypothetical protein
MSDEQQVKKLTEELKFCCGMLAAEAKAAGDPNWEEWLSLEKPRKEMNNMLAQLGQTLEEFLDDDGDFTVDPSSNSHIEGTDY